MASNIIEQQQGVSARVKRRASLGNQNAVTHGLFRTFRLIDERTIEGRAIRYTEIVLARALVETTPQQAAICRSVAIATWRLAHIEQLMVDELRKKEPDYDRIERWDTWYMRWSQHVRDGLRLLGLERKAKPVQDLAAYLAEKEAGAQATHPTTPSDSEACDLTPEVGRLPTTLGVSAE